MRVRVRLSWSICGAVLLCSTPSGTRADPVSTSGVYDAAGANDVERNASGNPLTSPNPNDYLGFKTAVGTAHAADLGGVITFAETLGGVGVGVNSLEATYGATNGKTLTISSSVSLNSTVSATFGETLSSATNYMVTTNVAGNGPDVTLNFGSIANGLPGEFVQRVGVTVLDKAVTVETIVTVTATYSGGSTEPIMLTFPIEGATRNLDTFVAFSAPAGQSITSLAFDVPGTNTNTSRFGFDELAFITAVPEPAGVGFGAVGAFALLRRRRPNARRP
jgi:hypothetical protein